MKMALACLLALISFSALAIPALNNLSKEDVEKVGNEFAANFSHTTVSAPETDGLWGAEVGLIGGATASPNLRKIVNSSGGDGSDFKHIYHGGLMGRAHLPLDFFFEATYFPQREISDVKVQNKTIGAGWNAGGFFGLPLDLAAGINFSSGDVAFTQNQAGTVTGATKVNVNTKSSIYWIGASKTFLFFTPYVKVGYAHTQAEIDVSNSGNVGIFSYKAAQNETVDKNGAYLTIGGNLQFFFFKLGFEGTQINTVKSLTGKLSLDF